MKKILSLAVLMLVALVASAQRNIDKLDRGLIAMKVSGGVYVNWRVQSNEYYDVTYNVYRDGTKLNAEPLKVSNYKDAGGSLNSSYTVRAVVKGVEQEACKPATPWSTSYKEITLKHEGIASTLVPNDACCADVDGDGELEILMKFDNASEIYDEHGESYPKNGPVVNGKTTYEYSIFEVLKLNGNRLWWVNCGPNMGDFQNNEQNIVGYDWDQDGKAEVVMRLLEGSTIHYADGTTYQIGANGQNGSAWTNYRAATGGGTNWFMHDGKEFLVYCNGETGEIYHIMDFPLARLESGETDLNKAWGDGYGHRSNKFFFGAPYLDGRKPSIFLARGIYTRHKMAALDVDPATHKLSIRWKWYNNTGGAWKGQGYHNYAIADVDWDGRDEIVFGSMVIDDNGKGLSTSGLGHGDAQHCGDFNPYMHGQEQFCCNEDEQGFNYRDATTSKIYAQTLHVGKDVGRAMAGNFTESFPGGQGTAWGDYSLVTNSELAGLSMVGVNSNFRIYWDGDLVEETFNYQNGKNTAGVVAKYGDWSPIYVCEGSMTNNDTKGTPCYQGDILGDWREEIIMRTPDNKIRIYSTPTPTPWWNYSLWYDHQYRNAMVWQMCGYNQPPHTSYFLGEMEGITMAPPPLTMTGRTEVKNGGTISGNQTQIVCETGNSTVTIASGATPEQLYFNVPTWVQGTAPSEVSAKDATINYITYTCTVNGEGIGAGNTRIIKQGDGVLNLPTAEFKHTGNTDVWAGTLNFSGTMQNSALWLNRFTTLGGNGTYKSIEAKYDSRIYPGGENNKGIVTTGELNLGMGARLVMDLYGADVTSDCIKLSDLVIETKTTTAWVKGGPTYLQPVIEIVGHYATGKNKLSAGKYVIAEISGEVQGSVDNIIVEGEPNSKKLLYIQDKKLILEIVDQREPSSVVWTGAVSGRWDFAETENFSVDGQSTTYINGDNVTFSADGKNKTITLVGSLQPASVNVTGGSAYTFKGDGAIDGNTVFNKEGSCKVTIQNNNTYTGGNHLKEGTVAVSKLSNLVDETGNLGGITNDANLFTMENGAVLNSTVAVTQGSTMKMVGELGGVIDNASDFKTEGGLSGTLLTKKGAGTLFISGSSALQKLEMQKGAVAVAGGAHPGMISVNGGTSSAPIKIYDDGQNISRPIQVEAGKFAEWQLTYSYYTGYSNKLTGTGTITIVPRNAVNRVRIENGWSDFEGTVKHNTSIWLPLKMTATCSKMTLDIASGCNVANVPGNTVTFGAVTGSGNLVNSGCDYNSSAAVSGVATWKIGNDTKDFTFAGNINNNSATNTCAFSKVGTCMMTMSSSKASTMSGAVTVDAGTLYLSSSSGKGVLGTGALSVKKGATLCGLGTLTNSSVTLANGASFWAGKTQTTSTGKMQFSNVNFTAQLGSHLYFNATAASCQLLSEINTFSCTGTIHLTVATSILNNLGSIVKEGEPFVIKLADANRYSGTPKFDLPELAVGYLWDTTSFLKDGTLSIIYDPTVSVVDIDADANELNDAYTIDGVYVGRPTKAGLYVIRGNKVYVK